MLMTTCKLILLRAYNASIGRFNFGKKFLRWFLERLVIKQGSNKTYTPSSKYFNIKYFKNEK